MTQAVEPDDDTTGQKEKAVGQGWSGLLYAAAFTVLVLVLWKVAMEAVPHASVTEPYAAALRDLASRSTKANSHLEAYYRQREKREVSGHDFLALCEEMRRLAAQDGVELPGRSDRSACALPLEP